MDEDLNIEYPTHIDCLLNKQSQTYSCTLTLHNKTDAVLYFYLVSTFGLYMRETTEVRTIGKFNSITLQFTFKPTNIITQDQEFIYISISPSKISQLCTQATATKLKIMLRFSQHFVDDPMIEEIVADEAKNILIQALHEETFVNNYKKAQDKYEQAFHLLRKCHDALFGLATTSLKMKDWRAALRNIETALLFTPENIKYHLLKAKILVECYGSCKSWEGEVMEECFNIIRHIQQANQNDLSLAEKEDVKNLSNIIAAHPKLTRMTVLKKELIARALDKYSEMHPISNIYSSKSDLSKHLKEILLSDQPQENATPDHVVDPISYQIMSQPIILPSGHSFQQKTLQQYFQKNGFKDPITRKDTYPQWMFPNNSLRDFINDHPKLKAWKQYEYDLVYK